MKKRYLILIIFIIILLICSLWLLFMLKPAENINQTYSDAIFETLNYKVTTEKTYEVLGEKDISNITKEVIKKENEKWKQIYPEKGGIANIYSPFFSKYGWVSQIKEYTKDRVVVDIKNESEETIYIDKNFISFFGNNVYGYEAETEIISGEGDLKPGEQREIILKGDGETSYFAIGQIYHVDDWAIYRLMSYSTSAAGTPGEIVVDDYEKYVVDSVPMIAKFDEFQLLTFSTNYFADSEYKDIKINKEQKQKFPDSCILTTEVNIYNKMEEDLVINSVEYVIKDSNNTFVEKKEILDFKEKISSSQENKIFIPFKYLDSNQLYSLILHTNIGNITIQNPDNIYGLINQ